MSLFLRQQEGRFFVLSELQSVGRNNRLNLRDVALGGKFKLHLAKAGKPQLQFAVHIQHPGSFNAESGDIAVRQGGEVLLFAGDALDVYGDDRLSVNTTPSRMAL